LIFKGKKIVVNSVVNNNVGSIITNLAHEVINKRGNNIMNKNRDDVINKVYLALKNSKGLTITDIVKKTKLNRSSVRTALAKLDGAERVSVRKIGMAKVYFSNRRKKK